MKKITLLSFAAILFTSVLNAQISKGSVYLGGSISGSTLKDERSTSPDEGKIKTLVINPQVGVAFKKKPDSRGQSLLFKWQFQKIYLVQ